jgi:uncharacterized protein DUF1843
MTTRKKSPRPRTTSKKKSTSFAAGAIPPYGIPIREAIARGDLNEMQRVAAKARRWLADTEAALDELEKYLSSRRA